MSFLNEIRLVMTKQWSTRNFIDLHSWITKYINQHPWDKLYLILDEDYGVYLKEYIYSLVMNRLLKMQISDILHVHISQWYDQNFIVDYLTQLSMSGKICFSEQLITNKNREHIQSVYEDILNRPNTVFDFDTYIHFFGEQSLFRIINSRLSYDGDDWLYQSLKNIHPMSVKSIIYSYLYNYKLNLVYTDTGISITTENQGVYLTNLPQTIWKHIIYDKHIFVCVHNYEAQMLNIKFEVYIPDGEYLINCMFSDHISRLLNIVK